MLDTTLAELEKLFLALSDKTRLRLLTLMVDGEVPVGYLVDSLGDSQPKISRHLAYLRNTGIVSTRRDGKWIYYAIEQHPDPAVSRVLDETLRSILAGGASETTRKATEHGDGYQTVMGPSSDSMEAYIDDWVPQEIEIFLL